MIYDLDIMSLLEHCDLSASNQGLQKRILVGSRTQLAQRKMRRPRQRCQIAMQLWHVSVPTCDIPALAVPNRCHMLV